MLLLYTFIYDSPELCLDFVSERSGHDQFYERYVGGISPPLSRVTKAV